MPDTIIEMPASPNAKANAKEIASKTKTNENMMWMVKFALLLLYVVGTLFLVINDQKNNSNQRHLNTAQLNVRVQGGDLRPFDVPASANLHDVHQAVEDALGHPVTLTFGGKPLPNDRRIFIADKGIGPECTIDAMPANLNDLQIFDRAITSSKEDFWRGFSSTIYNRIKRNYRGISQVLWNGIDSYDSFEAAVKALGGDLDVMEIAAEHNLAGKCYLLVEHKRIAGVSGWDSISVSFDLNELSKLPKLRILHVDVDAGAKIHLSALGAFKKLVLLHLSFKGGIAKETLDIAIPDMSKCTDLEVIEIKSTRIKTNIDCRKSNLHKTKGIFHLVKGEIEIVWPSENCEGQQGLKDIDEAHRQGSQSNPTNDPTQSPIIESVAQIPPPKSDDSAMQSNSNGMSDTVIIVATIIGFVMFLVIVFALLYCHRSKKQNIVEPPILGNDEQESGNDTKGKANV